MVEDAQVIQTFLQHVVNFVEEPQPAFGGLPVCPFARIVRLEDKIDFLVIATLGAREEEILRAAEGYAAQDLKEVLLVLYKDRAIACDELYQYIARINEKLLPLGLEAFGGHPQDDFQVQGVHTRRGPWPNFQVLKRSLATKASQSLWNTGYYRNWTPEQLRHNGLPREG
jgi:cobalamin biosynthesis Mg chelatase CobN